MGTSIKGDTVIAFLMKMLKDDMQIREDAQTLDQIRGEKNKTNG